MDEATLRPRLRKIEALHAGTNSDGERAAARLAAERIRARLAAQRTEWRDIVVVYSLDDPWKRKLFLALCRRDGLTPYREKGQQLSTVQVLALRKLHQKTLWPWYLALAEEIGKHLADLTDGVIREAIHTDVSEVVESGVSQQSVGQWSSPFACQGQMEETPSDRADQDC